jgi:molybdate transport system ATP-binding protein
MLSAWTKKGSRSSLAVTLHYISRRCRSTGEGPTAQARVLPESGPASSAPARLAGAARHPHLRGHAPSASLTVTVETKSIPYLSQLNQSLSVDLKEHLGIVGPNASGKRTILKALYNACLNARLQVELVDFDSHRRAVIEHGQTPVARFLGGVRDNADVIVRFGLSNVWWRRIKSLSTGEVRKVLLARAVCNNPQILFLDRPFDGLDAKSRKSLALILDDISNDAQQKQARPLVQGIKWQDRMPVKIVIGTHRAQQELTTKVKRVLVCSEKEISYEFHNSHLGSDQDRHGLSKFHDAFDTHIKHMFESPHTITRAHSSPNPTPGTQDAINPPKGFHEPLLDVQRLTVFPIQATSDVLEGKDPMRPLLDRVSWCVHPREVWWVQGENGASKSILLSCAIGPEKLLALASQQHAVREWEVETDAEADRRRRRPPSINCTDSVDMVSTELHIAMLEGPNRGIPALDYLLQKLPTAQEDQEQRVNSVLLALGLDPRVIRTRRFNELSLGQQKLLLLAGAFATRPRLLILDEPCQSLDLEHRRRVAAMVDQYCASKVDDVACVFVSHHEDELPRSVSHRLVLDKGRIISRGHYHVPPTFKSSPPSSRGPLK